VIPPFNGLQFGIVVAMFAVVTVLGFAATRWNRAASLASIEEWGLGGRLTSPRSTQSSLRPTPALPGQSGTSAQTGGLGARCGAAVAPARVAAWVPMWLLLGRRR
jgi:hypothetical protein